MIGIFTVFSCYGECIPVLKGFHLPCWVIVEDIDQYGIAFGQCEIGSSA